MAVLQGGPRRGALILKNQNVAKPKIFLEVQNPVAIGPQDILQPLGGEVGKTLFVVRGFDDDFVGADAVHAVIETEPFAAHVALHMQGGKFIGHHSHGPIGTVGIRGVRPVRKDFLRRQPFLSRAKRTHGRRGGRRGRHAHVLRAAAPFSRHDHPAPDDRISA